VFATLKTYGIRVPCKEALQCYQETVSDLGLPPKKKIKRRVYFVRAPRTLWHTDGHHSLIR